MESLIFSRLPEYVHALQTAVLDICFWQTLIDIQYYQAGFLNEQQAILLYSLFVWKQFVQYFLISFLKYYTLPLLFVFPGVEYQILIISFFFSLHEHPEAYSTVFVKKQKFCQ